MRGEKKRNAAHVLDPDEEVVADARASRVVAPPGRRKPAAGRIARAGVVVATHAGSLLSAPLSDGDETPY